MEYVIYNEGKRLVQGTENYLVPLGSVVILKDGNIIRIDSRALNYKKEKEKKYSDYSGQFINRSAIGKDVMMFNHLDIDEIVYVGYQNNVIYKNTFEVKQYIDNLNFERSNNNNNNNEQECIVL